MKGIFGEFGRVGRSEELFVICLVFREKPLRSRSIARRCRVELVQAQILHEVRFQASMGDLQNLAIQAQAGFHRSFLPRPHIAKPDRRQHIERRSLRTAIVNRHADGDVIRPCLRILDEHIEVASVIKHTRVRQIKFRIPQPTPPVLVHQPRIRKLRLRVFVERLQVGMRRRGVEVVVQLLHILTVIPLRPAESKQPLLQNRIAMIPKRQRQAHAALPIGDPHQPVLAPAIRPRSRLLMRKAPPRLTLLRVVLAHRRPLPFRQVRPPSLPVRGTVFVFEKALMLGGEVGWHFQIMKVTRDFWQCGREV